MTNYEKALTDVRVGVATSHRVIEVGIKILIEGRYGDLQITAHGLDGTEPDVLLYDVAGLRDGDCSDLDHWTKKTTTIVIALTHELRPDLGATALERGAAAVISIGATRENFLEIIEAAVTGSLEQCLVARIGKAATCVSRGVSLTQRESEIIGLIVQGLRNKDIADRCFLSINSVKSYIRSAYRKMDVLSRSQAVKWGIQHGFPMEPGTQAYRPAAA